MPGKGETGACWLWAVKSTVLHPRGERRAAGGRMRNCFPENLNPGGTQSLEARALDKVPLSLYLFSWMAYTDSSVAGNKNNSQKPAHPTCVQRPLLWCPEVKSWLASIGFSMSLSLLRLLRACRFFYVPRAFLAFPPARAQFLAFKEVRQGAQLSRLLGPFGLGRAQTNQWLL